MQADISAFNNKMVEEFAVGMRRVNGYQEDRDASSSRSVNSPQKLSQKSAVWV